MTAKKETEQKKPEAVKEKWELHITDTLKIQEYDSYNFAILVLTDGVNPKTKETTSSWKKEGYYTTIRGALLGVLNKDLLVDVNQISTIRDYQEETRKAFAVIQTELEGVHTING